MDSKTLKLMATQLEQTAATLRSLADSQDAAERAIAKSCGDKTMIDVLRAMRDSSPAKSAERGLATRILKAIARTGMTTWQELEVWPPEMFRQQRNYGEKMHETLVTVAAKHGARMKNWNGTI